jgi:predicted ATPase/class 3 adenylate cyclase
MGHFGMMAALPSGTVTFLFTDLEGSTRLWEEHPDAMKGALGRHDEILRDAIASHRGFVVKATGDGFHAVFATAHDAVDGAVDAQQALAAETWRETGSLRVRMGIHTGESQERAGDYFGSAVNRAARLMAVAHGGQIVCSRTTVEVAGPHVSVRSLGEHRLRDLGAPQELFQVGDGSFPPLQTLDVVPTNLPMVLTELIGRSEDIARIAAVLDHDRLVTLTGVGGVGKTRLALAVAGAAVDAFPDGVWLVELAPLTSAGEVARAAAIAMGAPATNATELAQYLSNRRALVVLDNCEHVLNEAAALAEAVLLAGPEAVIIATSREPLAVDGETVRGVRSLTVPEVDVGDAELAAAPAVRLFVERASAATDTFEQSDTDLPVVAAICARLDGIPLAIELAASRVRAMSPTEIEARLDERFLLLAGGRGAHERHRTLQAAVSWSHDLLGDAECRAFRRLSVFPASFDLAAAEAVAGDAETSVLDALLHLVDQSLVQHDATVGRYRLLETLRQYGADRLADAGETEWMLERHARWYTDFAAHQASSGGPPTVATSKRFDAEIDNFQAAADWLVAHEHWAQLARLAHHLFGFTFMGRTVPALAWYRAALEHSPSLDVQDRIDALGEYEYFTYAASGIASDDDDQSSIALADASGLLPSPWAWFARYLEVQARVDMDAARVAADTMLAVAKERGDELATITALGLLAGVCTATGHDAESTAFTEEGLHRARSSPDSTASAIMVSTAGAGYLNNRVDPDFSAGLAFLEANPVDPDACPPGPRMWLHLEWGLALVGAHHVERAVPHLARALRLASQSYPAAQMDVARALAVALGEVGHPLLAVELAGYASANFAEVPATGGSGAWLTPRLSALEGTLHAKERAAALERGTRLNRRGFMQLLIDAEQRMTAHDETGMLPSH